ncbi:MAG: crossover junction endodeoxyribonuclease RuvC [Candidatus Eremiobacter antarcticus]|nr:crossover junction endodeoxyribonuclease RuvC [Candidatus Eremiobacteraeota bacterium]MBC5807686.1 crossover junction endodeoxyribonuclease RuvC [Candidatus Eremiobacteraeota bacterium]PZR60493.1 MAG: crossover junction endodeoxyribonuclease RuvC [Candidatus Eremiobacter sp. RRmetagenome_bin22]
MKILGVDPSLHCTGYGVVECDGAQMRLVEGGIIAPGKATHLSQRLAELQRSLAHVITALHPDVMVVEEVFARTAYPRTAIMMAHARGALMCAAALGDVPVYHYAATAVKRALIGNGSASKEQVASMVVQTLRLRRLPSPPDVTDALALAITHGRRSMAPSALQPKL